MEVEIVSSGMVGVILLVGFVAWLIAVFILLLDIHGYLRRIANASDNQRYQIMDNWGMWVVILILAFVVWRLWDKIDAMTDRFHERIDKLESEAKYPKDDWKNNG